MVKRDITDMTHDEMMEHVQKETPEFEQFLLEAAKAAGATSAILFDGTEVKLTDD